ncbi:hypothetical protein PCC6912_39950 [Chlorogloeopsis fritschii PCC 6912]|uniref:Uncharacterized protein n=1 Tax=Chlorogloeopsis fritschii PCC 6912 TaxID=211165 RepID=A0A433N6B8_CHLFR|nr:hypothetical protein [Chlorogloeopsis fritschii]RUR77036.1 hypothetical protein PCC6912_39950 [Chlorogloeopsis fritschii PCC 6912]
MRIHVAEVSKERGQYQVLVEERYNSSLLSYFYAKRCEKYFEQYWVDLVKIHLASTTNKLQGETNIKKLLPEEGKSDALFSYAYKEHEPMWRDSWNMNIHLAGHTATPEIPSQVLSEHKSHLTTYADQGEIRNKLPSFKDLRPRVIIDSGAFTSFTCGKVINPRDYAAWALEFEQRWRDKMQFLRFMNLDVIGDQEGSWKNQAILEALGMKPIPIVTYGAQKEHLIRAIENYDYIALGGLVPHVAHRERLKKWLDFCFGIITPYFKKTSVMPKVHLLGITSEWTLQRYPCYSSDSSSWVQCLRFGGGKSAGLDKIPRYKESNAAMSATLHVLRAEIQKYKKMEENTTKLWAKRGVVWDE